MMKAGFASKVITPPKGISLAGYFNRRPNTGVLDDIMVRAAVFSDNAVGFGGLVSLDLLYSDPELIAKVEERLGKGAPQLQGKILFCATHTHTGPDLRDHGATSSDHYTDSLAETIAECAVDALSKIEAVEVKAAKADANPFAFIRRYWMRNGKVVTNPGKLNPDIVSPESELDREVSAIAFFHPGGRAPLAILANICNHTDTTGGTLVSADWPGSMERSLKRIYGPGFIAMSLIGASGDVNHFDVSSPVSQTSPQEAERIGKGYAEIFEKMIERAKAIDADKVSFSKSVVAAGKRKISKEELAKAEAIIARDDISANGASFTSEELAKGEGPIMRMFASELLRFAENEAGSEVELPIVNLRLGEDISIVSLPGEAFNAIGSAIKRSSSASFTLVASNSMDACGYIPLAECFERGGYETMPVSHGGMTPDTAEKIINAISELLKTERI